MSSKPWNWRKAYARLIGNFLISFGSPLMASVAITHEYLLSVLIGLVTATVVTIIAAGKMLDEWSQKKC